MLGAFEPLRGWQWAYAASLSLVKLADFFPEPWQWLASIYPPHFASKAYWMAEAGETIWPRWVLGGLVASALWLWIAAGAYLRAARRLA